MVWQLFIVSDKPDPIGRMDQERVKKMSDNTYGYDDCPECDGQGQIEKVST